jgi:lipopolysaccharide export system permease protein
VPDAAEEAPAVASNGGGTAARGRVQVVRAAHARYAISPDGNYYLIDLTDGESHEGVPGTGNWRITRFGQQTVRVPTPVATLPGKPRVDVLATAGLLRSSDPLRVAELHWRIGWVLLVIVAGLIAVPLARLRPRQGRHARVLWAVLFFAVYGGLLTAGRTVLERGDSPVALGLWWVHVLAIALGLALVRQPRLTDWLARRRLVAPRADARPASQ